MDATSIEIKSCSTQPDSGAAEEVVRDATIPPKKYVIESFKIR
jgi:hypothetical protein